MAELLLSLLDPATVFGVATVVVTTSACLPQLLQMRRGVTAGVSPAAAVNTVISFVAWTVYAVWVRDGWLLASSLIGLPGMVATAVVAVRTGGDRGSLRLPAIWTAALLGATWAQAAGLCSLVPLLVGTSIVWTVVPALATAWRSEDVSGIAAGTWWVQAGEGLLYLGYGLSHDEQAATSYSLACLLGSGGMLARLGTGRLLAIGSTPPRPPARRARHEGTWLPRPRAPHPDEGLREVVPRSPAVAFPFPPADPFAGAAAPAGATAVPAPEVPPRERVSCRTRGTGTGQSPDPSRSRRREVRLPAQARRRPAVHGARANGPAGPRVRPDRRPQPPPTSPWAAPA